MAHFDHSGGCVTSVYRCAYSKKVEVCLLDGDTGTKSMSQYPTMLLVCGYGVIVKKSSDYSEAVQKVKAEQDTFQWNYSPDKEDILFVRQSQIEHVRETILQSGAILSVQCFQESGEELSHSIESHARIFFQESIKFRNIIRPTESGSLMAQLLFKKLRVPVLCCILLLLVANYFIQERVNELYSIRHYELNVVRKSKGEAEKNVRLREQAIAGYGKTLPYSYAWLCDMIGSITPEKIILTSLSFQPVMKPLENDKWPVLAEREVVITGNAANPDMITTLISALQGLKISDNVKLLSVDKARESGKSVFKIGVTL